MAGCAAAGARARRAGRGRRPPPGASGAPPPAASGAAGTPTTRGSSRASLPTVEQTFTVNIPQFNVKLYYLFDMFIFMELILILQLIGYYNVQIIVV